MKISIIIAILNGEKTILNLLESIKSQSHKDIEVIIMDGLSSDNTLSILKNNISMLSRVESKKDSGISEAWNNGLKYASGEWVMFLGSDDKLAHANSIKNLVAKISENQDLDLVYGKTLLEDNSKSIIGSIFNKYKFIIRMTIPHTATLHNIKLFKERNFDINFKIAMDYEFLLGINNIKCLFVNDITTIMGGGGISTKMIDKSLKEAHLARLKNKTTPKLISYMIYLYCKHKINYVKKNFV